MTENERLYDAAIGAITRPYSDQTVSRLEARRNLEALVGEVEVMLDTLNDDQEDQSGGEEDVGS